MDDRIGGFTLERRIGVGGMGEVWRASAPDGTVVALKVAGPRIRDDAALSRVFDAEIRALAKLDHPRVAWLYDHGRTEAGGPFPPGCPYAVLEHCGGGSLGEREIPDWAAVREVLVGLLDALAHVHAHGLVHRDLKPANVLWSAPTDVRPGMKLADFGIARDVAAAAGLALGSSWYLAPEQLRRGPPTGPAIGPWTDLYALGALAWELVTGDPPNLGDRPQDVLASALAGPPRFEPTLAVPDGLEGWLRTLLAADTTARPRWAAAALSALSAVDPAVQAPSAAWRPRSGAGPRLRLRLQGAGLHLVALREPDLAGRASEREALWTALRDARTERRLQVVVVRGISGIGKSRLCRWLAERAAELALAETVAVSARETQPLVALLAGLTGVPPGEGRVAAVEAALTAWDPAAAGRLGPAMRAPGRPWGTLPIVRRLLVQAAELEPQILVLDDAQHSLDAVRLARSLRADAPKAPLLVVLSVEEEVVSPANDAPRAGADQELRDQLDALCDCDDVRTLTVGPLTAAEQEELLESLVELDPESRSVVLTRAGGHPGYLVAQVTRWAGQGALAPSRRGFRLVAPAKVPTNWTSMWADWMSEWLDGLEPADRLLLEQAAVIGRAVDEGLWGRVCDDPEARMPGDRVQIDLASARRRAQLVNRLVDAGLAYDTDTGFTFTHPALVEVLVAGAKIGSRFKDLHEACANHLRRMPMPDHALALGAHLAEAEAWDAAATTLLAGIAHHWRFRDRRPLLTELRRAERCVEAAGWAADDPRQTDLVDTRAMLLVTAGRPDEGAVLARQAVGLARKSGDRVRIARTLWRLVDALVIVSRWEEAAEVIPAFLEVEDVRGEPAQSGLARSRMARFLLARGDRTGAERWFAEAETELLAAPRSTLSLGALLELYGFTGRHQRILEVGPELERLAYEEGRTDHHLFALSKEVEAFLALGRFEEGIAAARECLRINDLLGDQRFARYMRVELGILELRAHRASDAVATLTEALAILDRREFTWLALTALLARIEAWLAAGDLEAADRDTAEVALLVETGRFERDALVFRLDRLRNQLVDRGFGSRAARVEALLLQVTDPAPRGRDHHA